MRNNLPHLSVLDVDKQISLHVLSTTETKEACGNIISAQVSGIIANIYVRINSGSASHRGGARYGKARLSGICACMHLVYPCWGYRANAAWPGNQ